MTKTVGAWFTPGSFAPAVNHFGSEGAGSIVGPGYNNWDLAAIKNTKLVERLSLQLRGEFFNAWNHESFFERGQRDRSIRASAKSTAATRRAVSNSVPSSSSR